MKASEARKLLAQLKELEVGRVMVGPSYLEIDFTGEHNLHLRVNKSFDVIVDGITLNWDFEAVCAQPAASHVVACVSAGVVSLRLSADELTWSCTNGVTCKVALLQTDFEPVEVSCTHCLHPDKLEWMTPVVAG